MKNPVRITLHPLGKTLHVEQGAPLQDVLFDFGVEFPCGGHGSCRGCRVKIIEGHAPVTLEQQKALSETELQAGWRLACRLNADSDLTFELAQWQTPILADESTFDFTPCDGYGIAVDLGTTTLVVQLVDRRTGAIQGVRTALNPQAQYGSDLMTRIEYALSDDGQQQLCRLLRQSIYGIIRDIIESSAIDMSEVAIISIVGNTAMHHLFCGIDIAPLSVFPFEPVNDGLMRFSPDDLGWDLSSNTDIRFLPSIGGFVGSDLLAGIMAVDMAHKSQITALIDLGTNGEIIVGNQDRILCASTAAGPAFEGGRISKGMRASTGAIYQVNPVGDSLKCKVIGHTAPIGICGSGLVDAVSACLENGMIDDYGRFTNGEKSIVLQLPVSLTQKDVRELQLAKGAIAAGLVILIEQLDLTIDDIDHLYLAGAFGNTINSLSASRIGLFGCSPDKVVPAGNTALIGAKMSLFSDAGDKSDYTDILKRCEHVALSGNARFQEVFVDQMMFPTD